MFQLLAQLGVDPTSMPSGSDLNSVFNSVAWKYSLVILAIVFSLFAFVCILRFSASRRDSTDLGPDDMDDSSAGYANPLNHPDAQEDFF